MRALVIGFGLIGVFPQANAAALVESFATSIGGDTNGTPGCHTYGPPTTVTGWNFGIVSIPVGGIAPCGYQGTFHTSSAATGGVSDTAAVTANFFDGNSYAGTASGLAQFGYLSVSAAGKMTAYSTIGRLQESAGFAAFDETFAFPGSGSGAVIFEFDVDGGYDITPNLPYATELLAYLQFKVNNVGSGYTIFNTYGGNSATPFLPQVPVADNWAKGAGSLKGSAKYRTPAIPITFNVPFLLSVGLATGVYPCCFGASASAEFSARLSRIIVMDSTGAPVDFTTTKGGSGTTYTPAGASIPEPGSLLLTAAGILALTRRIRSTA